MLENEMSHNAIVLCCNLVFVGRFVYSKVRFTILLDSPTNSAKAMRTSTAFDFVNFL